MKIRIRQPKKTGIKIAVKAYLDLSQFSRGLWR